MPSERAGQESLAHMGAARSGPGQEGFGEGCWGEEGRLSGGQVNPLRAGIFQAASQRTAREDVYNTCLQSPKGY